MSGRLAGVMPVLWLLLACGSLLSAGEAALKPDPLLLGAQLQASAEGEETSGGARGHSGLGTASSSRRLSAGGRLLRQQQQGQGQQQAQPADPPLREVCTNTCNKARNGVCEEGWPGKLTVAPPMLMTYCDLGTDCEDCGPWKTAAANVTWEDPRVMGPVRLLKNKDVQIRVKNASVPAHIRFAFAYTDPNKDYDVSYHLEGSGIIEAGITAIVYKILNKRCVRPDGGRELVVDVGANFGWFAILAARMGCRVIAYEPVPLFRAFLEYNMHLNNLAHLIQVRTAVVSHESGKKVKMVVPGRGIWGSAGIEGLNIDPSIQSDQQTIELPTVRLEDEVRSDVLLLKVDVEGWEWAVLRGAEGLLGGHEVHNIVMEYSPGVPERHFRYDDMLAHPSALAQLISTFGYRIGHIGDAGKHHSAAGWDGPPPAMREVTLANLKYDIEDVKRWKAGTLACPTPEELRPFPAWNPCGGVPEGLNPRSFRSELSHNTKLWVAKAKGMSGGLLALDDVVGILNPSDPPEMYFQIQGVAMGGRQCEYLDAQTQVKHRCRCTFTDCAAEEAAVDKAASLGKIPQNYVLS